MSPEGTGSTGEAATTAEPPDRRAANADAADASRPDDDDVDPWFAPGPKVSAWPEETAAAGGGPELDGALNGHADPQADWFLRTGRAGLMPDAMTVDWGDDETVTFELRVESAGAPPWAGEKADMLASAPPWETGPWPGPGEPDGRPAAAGRSQDNAGGQDAYGGRGYAPGGPGTSWSARAVALSGLVPLVVPGFVIGIRTLRQPAGAALRKAAWLAIGASVAWALIIILVVTALSGGGAAACSGYPATVRQAYHKALADLTDHAPPSVLAPDLETAANLANSSAAGAGQIGVRTALFAMANDMAQARADVLARRPVPVALRHALAQDGTAPTGSCAD
jgi:hypothetical protein